MAETRGWVCHVCRQIRPIDERFCNGDVSVSHAPTCHCGQPMNEATSGAYRGLLHCGGWCDQFHDDCPQCKPPVGVAYNTEARTIAEGVPLSAGQQSIVSEKASER